MGKLGETKLAKLTVEEIKKLVRDPVDKKENEISFGEFMKVYDPSIESHNFTYPIPDHHNFLNLQIYNVMMQQPFVVLKLEHPFFYREGLTLEFHFGSGRSRTTQCSNDFLYEEIQKLEKEIFNIYGKETFGAFSEVAYSAWYKYHDGRDEFRRFLDEKVIFRKEYFPQPIIEEVERQKSLGTIKD